MENQNKITLENGLEITGATLLTIEEVEKLPKETLAIGRWWWLRSPGYNNGYAAGVDPDGSINYNGCIVFLDGGFIRPVLVINLKYPDLAIGDRFQFWNKEFEITSEDRALCTESVGDCFFRENWRAEDSNDYEKSDAKKFVDDWFHDAVSEFSQTGINEKTETRNRVVLENGLGIAGATLLTIEEAEKLPKKTRAIGEWWWLRSPGDYRRRVVTVCSDGFVYYDEICADIVCDVRPALVVLNPESVEFNIGDRFRFGENEFEIISEDRALCTESIGKCAFREEQKARDANRYETSDVKKFVDKWYQNVISGQKNGSPAEIKTARAGDIRIMGITLLTAEEAEELPKNILATGKRWWLKTPGSRDYAAAVVDPDGFVDDCGWVVNKPRDVRPALIISYPEHSGVKTGDKFYFASEEFQVISAGRALCTGNFGRHPFRKKANVPRANDYSDSDVRKFLEEWYAGSIRKQKESRGKEQKQQAGSYADSGNFDCMLEELKELQKKAIAVKNEEVSFYATGMMEKVIRIVEKYR